MDQRTLSSARAQRAGRGQWFGALAACLAAALSLPSVGSARAPRRRGPVTPVASRVDISLGSTAGAAREMLTRVLSDAITHDARLRLVDVHAAVRVTANVRNLTVTQEAAGSSLARCELALVATDGNGAVRAMLEVRGIARSNDRASAEQQAMRGAADGAVRRLVATL